MRKSGFTLVEMLATVIILSLIALITIPQIMKVLNNSQKDSFMDSATGLLESAELYNSEHAGEKTHLNLGIEEELRKLKFKGTPPIGGSLKINENGDMSLAMYNKKWCAVKNIFDNSVEVTSIQQNNYDSCKALDSMYKISFRDLLNDSSNTIQGRKPSQNEDGSISFYENSETENNILNQNILDQDFSQNFVLGVEFSTNFSIGNQTIFSNKNYNTLNKGLFIYNNENNLNFNIGSSNFSKSVILPETGKYLLLISNTKSTNGINGYLLINIDTKQVIKIEKNPFDLTDLNEGIKSSNNILEIGANSSSDSNFYYQSKSDKKYYSFTIGNEVLTDKAIRSILKNYYNLKELSQKIDLKVIGGNSSSY